jgi:flagellar biogenesis protein FliO
MSNDGLAGADLSVNAPAKSGPPPGQKIVLGVVIFLGVLILIAMGALVVGLAKKFTHGGKTTAPVVAAQSLKLTPGSKIEALEVSGDRLVLRVMTATGEEIDIVDLKDGHVISRITTAPPDVPH